MTQKIAESLWLARQTGNTVASVEFPTNLDDAYAIQFEVDHISECRITGYKIGATSDETMQMLGLDEPFFGPLYEPYTRCSGDQIPLAAAHEPKVEAEFVVALAEALPDHGQVTTDNVINATEWIAGGLEIIGSRYAAPPAKRGLCVVADTGANIDFIVGEPITQFSTFDLNQHPVRLAINGASVASGHSGMSIAGNPFGMVAWLANHPKLQSRGLLAGDLISCGTCTGVVDVKPGDVLSADYGPLGQLVVELTPL